jgi:hypothetical protein
MTEAQKIADPLPELAIKYIHLRRSQVVVKEFRIINLRRFCPLGGLTVAYLKHAPNVYKVAFARCQPDEHYSKAQGRSIATVRLLEDDEVWYVSTEEGRKPYEAIVELVECVRELRSNFAVKLGR